MVSPDRIGSGIQRPRELAENDPEFRSALGQRAAGIVILSVGSGAGLVLALAGGVGDNKALAVGGLITLGLGLGVGVPLTVGGHRRVKAIRARARRRALPEINVSLGRESGRLGLTWKF